MQTKKLFNISQQDFEVMDYDLIKLVATISVSDFNDTDDVELTQHDICETALAFRLIDSYYDPITENGNFLIDDYGHRVDFSDWWDNVDGTDKEKILSGAIATKADISLHAISKKLFRAASAA